MAGCFGNHPVDRWIESETMRYLDGECDNDCCTCEERCDSMCDGCDSADDCAVLNAGSLGERKMYDRMNTLHAMETARSVL